MFCGQLLAKTWIIWCLNKLRAVHSLTWCSQVVTLASYTQGYYRESDRMIVEVQIELSAILSMKLV